jgi:Rrf2 family transcriptional regulator, iron-sulfur cluster assembly transcription factor
MITREADYALRVALCLTAAQREGQESASCAEVAGRMDVPYRFLRKIVKRMVAAGLIRSARGKGGGLRLAREPHRITLLDVVRAIGPTGVTLNRCLTRPGACSRSGKCRAHAALSRIQQVVDRQLASLTMDNLA